MKIRTFWYDKTLEVPANGRLHHMYVNTRERDYEGNLWGYVTWNTWMKVVPGSHRYEMATLIWTKL